MYKDFLEKAGLTNAPVLMKGIAYELLLSTCKGNKISTDELEVPEDLADQKPLLKILDLAETWSNDLMDIFVEYAKDEQVDTPIVKERFKWIWKYLGIV